MKNERLCDHTLFMRSILVYHQDDFCCLAKELRCFCFASVCFAVLSPRLIHDMGWGDSDLDQNPTLGIPKKLGKCGAESGWALFPGCLLVNERISRVRGAV